MKVNSSVLKADLYLGEYDKFLQTCRAKTLLTSFFYRALAEYYLGRGKQAGQHFDQAYSLGPSLMPARVGKALSESMAGQGDAAPFFARQKTKWKRAEWPIPNSNI